MNGQQRKEAGQQLALFNADDWVDTAISRLKEFCASRKQANAPQFRLEEFRMHVESIGVEAPPSHKAWGSLPRIAMKHGLIAPTNEYQSAQSARTHAHPVRVWVAL